MLLFSRVAIFGLSSFSVVSSAAVQERSLQSPPTVYQAISSRVSDFEARLSEMHLQNKQALAARGTDFEGKLQAQRQANAAMAAANVDLAKDVRGLEIQTRDLRARALELQQDNELWKQDYITLEANITTVLELTNNTLLGLDTDSAAPELNVLQDLEEMDKRKAAEQGHEVRFNEILVPGKKALSLLATNAIDSDTPRSLLKVLDAGIQDMSEEFNTEKAVLDKKYGQLFEAEMAHHEHLLAEQRNLLASKQQLADLDLQLKTAVQKLESVNAKLTEQGRAIRLYAQRLGIRSLPLQHKMDATQPVPVLPHQLDSVEPSAPAAGDQKQFLQAKPDTETPRQSPTDALRSLLNLR